MRFYSTGQVAHSPIWGKLTKGIKMDLGRMDALFQQRREGHTLPQGLYTDPDSFDFDMAAIFGQSWLMAGLECELPKAGSYLSMMVGKWPVIITRDRQGDIRAFHNS